MMNVRTDSNPADRWLMRYMAEHGGRVSANDVVTAGHAAGLSLGQLKYAKHRLRVRSEHPVVPGPWYWLAPSTGTAAGCGGCGRVRDLDGNGDCATCAQVKAWGRDRDGRDGKAAARHQDATRRAGSGKGWGMAGGRW